MNKIIFIFLFIISIFFIVVSDIDCPVCGSSSYFTGTTTLSFGHLLHLYKCANGHEFWIR